MSTTALHAAPVRPASTTRVVQRRMQSERTRPPVFDETLQSSGSPLDPAARKWFESRFGRDFSDVRVHTDERAAQSARAVNALAYTSGEHIAFDAGQYAPYSERGQRLVAHELTHVVQQRARLPLEGVSEQGDAAEREAERNADGLTSLRTLTFDARPTVVARQASTATESAPIAACTDEQRHEIGPAATMAHEWLDQKAIPAVRKVADEPAADGNDTTRSAIARHFRSAEPEVVARLLANLERILSEMETLLPRDPAAAQIGRLGPPTRCQTDADRVCADADAYVLNGFLNLCPGFFRNASVEFRAALVIHEVAHAVGMEIVDRAYIEDRLLDFLTTREALSNAESYAMFVEELGTGRVVRGTPLPEKDEIDEGCAPGLQQEIRAAIGRAERWNTIAAKQAARHDGAGKYTGDFSIYLGNAEPATRAEAARIFSATKVHFRSPIDVVCDAETGTRCSGSDQAYGETVDYRGLGLGLGIAIGVTAGIVLGSVIGMAAAAAPLSLGTAAAVTVGLAAGHVIGGLLTGLGAAIGAAATHGRVHICPNWTTLDITARAESLLAAVYEGYEELDAEQSRKYAGLARALHETRYGEPPEL
jgi:uncharacterized protein DUF4157